MMELKKPQQYSHEYRNLIETIRKKLIEFGLLDKHPDKYHVKIIKDYMKLHFVVNHVLPEDENNVILECFKFHMCSGYFILLTPSKYQIDVEDYIKALFANFQNIIMDSDSISPTILTANQLLGGRFDVAITPEIMITEMIYFLVKYCKEKWPESIEEIANLSPE